MIILFEAVGLGTTGVTKQIVNDCGFVVSVEEIRIFVPRGSNPQHPTKKRGSGCKSKVAGVTLRLCFFLLAEVSLYEY